MANLETQVLDDIIVKSRRKMLSIGGAALAGLVLGSTKKAQAATTYTDADILNFALNLEYLEANFYYISSFGCTINAPNAAAIKAGAPSAGIPITGSVGTAGIVVAGYPTAPVPFAMPAVAAYAVETAIEEGKHVLFLQKALGSSAVAQPAINLTTSWGVLASAAQIPNGSSFSPYANDSTFLVGAYVFEDVGVTAYHGAAPLLTSSGNLSAAAGILAVEAYHAGLVRTSIAGIDPSNTGIGSYTTLISTLRATLATAGLLGVSGGSYDGGTTGIDDYGVAPFPTPVTLGASGSTAAATRLVDADSTNSIAFARNPTQVLNIVTGGGAVASGKVVSPATGVFFPAGLNAGPNGFK